MIDFRTIVTFLGLTMIGSGLAFVSYAAALAVPGALLFLLAVVPPFLPRPGGR